MLDHEGLPWAVLALSFAGFVKGATGFGLPLLAVPALANILEPKMAVIIMSIPTLVAGAMMAVQTRSWEVVGSMGPLRWLIVTLVLGTVAGANLLATLDTGVLGLAVGFTSVAFTIIALQGQSLDIRNYAGRLTPVIGLAAGVLNGTTNISGPLIAIYLKCLQLEKRTFVSAINVLFTCTGVVQIISYVQLGLYTSESLVLSLGACLPIFLGVTLGLRANFLMGQKLFDRAVLVLIFISGVRLIVNTLMRS
ncbi:MAG: sulfite exporter TauE/SafE family protein [Chloroflexota bacterium]